MPYLEPYIEFRSDDAIEQAQEDTIERAKDIWGLDYADNSDGLYPAGNQIGRSQLRTGMTRGEAGSAQVMPETIGGQWTTVIADPAGSGAAFAIGTDANGFLSGAIGVPGAAGGVPNWLDFIVDEDMFIIHEGFFSRAGTPTITEFQWNLSGTRVPSMNIEDIYVHEDTMHKGYLEVPNVVSPKSQVIYSPRSRRVGLAAAGIVDVNNAGYTGVDSIAEPFGPIAEAIAKRSFLIRQTY